MEVCQVLPKLKYFILFFQTFGIMTNFAKIKKFNVFLRNLWRFVKFCPKKIIIYFCQIYGIMSIFPKLTQKNSKFIELCQVLSKVNIFIYL
jgi:hypothetical protein